MTTDKTECLIEWVEDNWCDNNCLQSDSCFSDASDCICDETSTETAYCEVLVDWIGCIVDQTGTFLVHAATFAFFELVDDVGVVVSVANNLGI